MSPSPLPRMVEYIIFCLYYNCTFALVDTFFGAMLMLLNLPSLRETVIVVRLSGRAGERDAWRQKGNGLRAMENGGLRNRLNISLMS